MHNINHIFDFENRKGALGGHPIYRSVWVEWRGARLNKLPPSIQFNSSSAAHNSRFLVVVLWSSYVLSKQESKFVLRLYPWHWWIRTLMRLSWRMHKFWQQQIEYICVLMFCQKTVSCSIKGAQTCMVLFARIQVGSLRKVCLREDGETIV